MVPGSLLMTGQVPASVGGVREGSAAPSTNPPGGVDPVVSENHKLLRNMKQLEEDLFQSECAAVSVTEERTALQSAFQTSRDENHQLRCQNETLGRQLRQKAAEDKHELHERLKEEILRMTSERGSLHDAKRRTELKKKRLERSARVVQLNYHEEHTARQDHLKSLTSDIS